MKLFFEEKYPNDIENFYFAHVNSDDDVVEYICKTCDTYLIKGRIPAQAVCNKLENFDVPEHFNDLRLLEKVLIARRLLFKKILTMPRGEFRKIRGTICNLPLDSPDVVTELPRGNDSNSIVILKLKRKLEYKGIVYYESVRPSILLEFLTFLKDNNPLYSDIELVTDNVPKQLLNLGTSDEDDDSEIDFSIKNVDEEKDGSNE